MFLAGNVGACQAWPSLALISRTVGYSAVGPAGSVQIAPRHVYHTAAASKCLVISEMLSLKQRALLTYAFGAVADRGVRLEAQQ